VIRVVEVKTSWKSRADQGIRSSRRHPSEGRRATKGRSMRRISGAA